MNPQDRIHLPQDEDRLLEYLDGQLPASEARAIEAHLAACPECQALRRQWEQLDEKLARTLAQPRLSPDFAARLREQVAPGARAAVRVREGGEPGASTHEPWIEARRRATRVSWLGLLDGLGYGTVAAAGAYWLFHLAVAWVPGHAGADTALLRAPAFLLALATAGAALLVGLNLAAKNRIWRWLGAI